MERITLPNVNAFDKLEKLRLKEKKKKEAEELEEKKQEDENKAPSITGLDSKYYFRQLNKDIKKEKEEK